MLTPLSECFTALAQSPELCHTFVEPGGRTRERSFAETFALAERVHAALLALGLQRGDRIALMSTDAAVFAPVFLGAVRGGMVPVPLAPLPSHAAGVPERSAAALRVAGARALISSGTELASARAVGAALSQPPVVVDAGDLFASAACAPPPHSAAPGDLCFLQFTSGSTGHPKGVSVRHENLAANARLVLQDSLRITAADRMLSWLPLYHDMGLVGMFLAPLLHRIPAAFMPPRRFVRSPRSWLEAASALRATITCAPSFAFALAARSVKDIRSLDLSALRVAGCGGEPVQPRAARTFAEALAPAGFDARALTPSYGMAEATLGIAISPAGRGLRTLHIDRAAHERCGFVVPVDPRDPTAFEVASCGFTGAGHALRIADASGRSLPEGQVGEVAFSGPSVSAGYFRDAAASAETFQHGELRTGDLGFLWEGELFVSGRKKELIIVHGRNYYPSDIEWAIADVAGVRPGGVAVFAVESPEGEAAVALVEHAGAGMREAARTIAERVQEHAGLVLDRIVFVAPGSLPRTTSGKLQRRLARQRWVDGDLRERSDRSAAQRTAVDAGG